MRHALAALLLASTPALLAAEPTPKEQLLVPPGTASHYVVVSDAGKHGDIWAWTQADGSRAYRYSQSLRGWITETDEVVRLAPDGTPADIAVRGVSISGDQAERFSVADGKASWKSEAEAGSAPAEGRFYLAVNGLPVADDLLVARLATAGEAGAQLLPTGRATLQQAGGTSIKGPRGKQALRLAFIRGIYASPQPVWLDDGGKFWGYVGHISFVPSGFEASAPALRDFQEKAIAEAAREIARRFLTAEARAPVLFENVRLFDADKGVFLDQRAVLAANGKVAAVGPAGSITKLPAGTRTIDGRGRTLVPGLWDSHRHMGDDWGILSNMSEGITSFRSPGDQIDRTESVFGRRKAGALLAPEGWVSAIVDRKDPLAAQGALTVSSEAETIAAVRKIKAAGLWGVKFYTSMNPAWIAPAAKEAHRLGLHVHGHVPARMRPLDAVRAGYDEVTHINFVAMQFMPTDVVDRSNTAQRMEGPAKHMRDVDLNSQPVRELVAEFARRKTIVDPTLVVFEGLMAKEGGAPGPADAPYAAIVPPMVARQFNAGGYPLKEGQTRAQYQASFAKLRDLVGVLHRGGVTIVAGTDGEGRELLRELELYRDAGLTPAQALQTATIVPARMVGANRRTGSIAAGKEADMVLVDGDVSSDLGALRRVLTVVSDGYVLDGDALREASGYSGRPK